MLRPCIEPGCPNLSTATRCQVHQREAKTRLTGARGSTRQWRKLRANVIERDHHRCTDCASTDQLTVHHRDGNARNDTMANLTTLCEPCHIQIERQKLAIPRGGTPNQHPLGHRPQVASKMYGSGG